eukprot:NODE_456_length_7225_cov_1.202498.p5 type:complete len:220 gc:universal NODE_456_length_7225_cov_1.202498:6466-7125(+)
MIHLHNSHLLSSRHANLLPKTNNQSMKFYQGNWNIYLIIASIISLAFVLVLGTIKWIGYTDIKPSSGIHFIAVTITVICCIWNLLHTPSHGPTYKQIHRYVGRCAMIFGYIGAISGFIVVWHDKYGQLDSGFSIGISIGGALQLISQTMGYIAIKRNKIKQHSRWMIFFFFGGCLIPAFMRLDQMVNSHFGASWPMYCWIFPLILGGLAVRAFQNKSFY